MTNDDAAAMNNCDGSDSSGHSESAVTSGHSAVTTTSGQQRVDLNVGGHHYSTSLSTLTRDNDSMLARMFSNEWLSSSNDNKSEYFIDRDGHNFRHILNYLRDGPTVCLPTDNQMCLQELLREAEFYQLQGLQELVKSKLLAPQRPIKTGEVVRWRTDAIDLYWRPLALNLATEGIEFAFMVDKVGRKYNDKQTYAMCFGCCQKFLVDQITVFEYKIRFDEWEALRQHMHYVRGVITETVNDTCCVVEWPNRKTLHIPMTAVVPAD